MNKEALVLQQDQRGLLGSWLAGACDVCWLASGLMEDSQQLLLLRAYIDRQDWNLQQPRLLQRQWTERKCTARAVRSVREKCRNEK